MWMRLEYRRYVLLAFTGLVVAVARHYLQYGRPPWSSGITAFLGSWLAHYLFVGILCAIVSSCWDWSFQFFIGETRPAENGAVKRFDEAIVVVCIVLLSIAAMMLAIGVLNDAFPEDYFQE